MTGNLDPHTRLKLASLKAMAEKVQHLHGMVERYATTRDPRQLEMLTSPLKRAFGALKLALMGEGFDTLSQLAGSMEVAAGRGGSQRQKIRILREGIGSLRSQIEQEQRKLVTEDRARQRARAADTDAARGGASPDAADAAPGADPDGRRGAASDADPPRDG